jgi:diguanylate cyclase (GGDEF)-like protein/PAS domain S-box-containing protein
LTKPTSSGVAPPATIAHDAQAIHEGLVDERRFIEAALDIAGSLICVFDAEGRFLRFNRACELVSGYTFEELRGRPFFDLLVPKDEVEGVRTAIARIRPGDPPSAVENHWVTRDGALRLISWLDVCFFDEHGTLTHIVSTGNDITDERRAEDALRGIEKVGTLLAKQGPTPESLGAVMRTLSDTMGYRYLALLLRDGEAIRLGAQLGYDKLPESFDPKLGIIGRVFRTGEAAFVADVSRDPEYRAGRDDVTSEIVVPLSVDGQTLGALSIESTVEAPLTAADLRLAQTIAERLSVAIVLGREQQAVAERARLFTALAGFAHAANGTLDDGRLVPALVGAIGDVLEVDAIGLVTLDRSTGRFIVRAVQGGLNPTAVGTAIKIGDGVAGRAIASRAFVFARGDRSHRAGGLHGLISGDGLSMVCMPLLRDGAVLGAIVLGRRTEREPGFNALETEVLAILAAQTALAIANAQLLEEVSELAIRDALTGLFNRRHFDATLEHILRRRARERGPQAPIAAVMFDLDHFGRFNKEQGHQAGDAVLRAFAGILLERFRSSDLVTRYGGEEFVVILESATVEDATRIAEQVRITLAAREIIGPEGTTLRATVSAGCAALDEAEATREALIRAADVGLFMAKRAGRNKVVAV